MTGLIEPHYSSTCVEIFQGPSTWVTLVPKQSQWKYETTNPDITLEHVFWCTEHYDVPCILTYCAFWRNMCCDEPCILTYHTLWRAWLNLTIPRHMYVEIFQGSSSWATLDTKPMEIWCKKTQAVCNQQRPTRSDVLGPHNFFREACTMCADKLD